VAEADGPLTGLFHLERAETYEVPVPFVEQFQGDGDVERYAREYTDFYRAFTEPVLRQSFAGHPDLERLVAEVFGRAEGLVREDPARYEFHYIAVAVLLTRRDAG